MSELSFKTYYPSTAVNTWIKVVIMMGYLMGIIIPIMVYLYQHRSNIIIIIILYIVDNSLVFPIIEKSISISLVYI